MRILWLHGRFITTIGTVLEKIVPCHSLSKIQIDTVLPKISTGLSQYQEIQRWFAKKDKTPDQDALFRKRFNAFYRVRRNANWRKAYFALMEEAEKEALSYQQVLDILRQETTRFEASFASKLVTTINPKLPVIDKFVLQNMGLSLPSYSVMDRADRILQVYVDLQSKFDECLQSETGRYLVNEFKSMYPDAKITEVKMLDLVLWKTRKK